MTTFLRTDPFFVQEYDRGPWHVETPEDPEEMLCGIEISVDASSRIQKRWGLKPCLWCERELEELIERLPSRRSSSLRRLIKSRRR